MLCAGTRQLADERACLVRAAPGPPKRILPSASAMMAAASSWARPESEPMPVKVDDVGTQYHNVAPPAGVRAEDGVMGGGADFIKPVWGGGGVSLDSSKVCAAFVRGGRVAKTNQCRHALRCMWTCRPTQGCAHWRAAR